MKEAQNTDQSYRETVDLHELESIHCMNDIAVHVLLLDNYNVSLGIKKNNNALPHYIIKFEINITSMNYILVQLITLTTLWFLEKKSYRKLR